MSATSRVWHRFNYRDFCWRVGGSITLSVRGKDGGKKRTTRERNLASSFCALPSIRRHLPVPPIRSRHIILLFSFFSSSKKEKEGRVKPGCDGRTVRPNCWVPKRLDWSWTSRWNDVAVVCRQRRSGGDRAEEDCPGALRGSRGNGRSMATSSTDRIRCDWPSRPMQYHQVLHRLLPLLGSVPTASTLPKKKNVKVFIHWLKQMNS